MAFLAALRRVISTWTINFINLFIFIFTYGFLTFSEGRYYAFSNKWANWNLFFKCEPKTFLRATEEREICDFVKRAIKVRVVAGGHSFNPSPLSNDLLISLDLYNGVVKFDKDLGIITVQAGMRLRKLIEITEDAGWALPVMGTANIQSIGGLVASDLHSSGRESGYLSQQIESIRIVNSKGVAETFAKNTEVFKSAIGGMGAMGVVVEVTLQLVPKFLVRRVTTYVDREEAENAVELFLEKHDHVGFFYIGGLNAKKIRLTTYDHAQPHERITFLVYFKNFVAQIFDLVNGGFLLDFAKYFPSLLNTGYFMWNSTFLGQPFVNNPGASFTTNLFFQHDEMEYALPRENFRKCIGSLMDYLDRSGTVALMEVRFTVHHATTKALLGPGADRETCWIEILPTLTQDTRKIFAATEHIFEENGGRPHLGKYTTYQKPDMEKHHSEENVQRWLVAREKQDPEHKFVNNFIHQVFMDERSSNPSHPHF